MNKATRTNVAILGTIFGISGFFHGFFEVLQGNVPTDGFFISAIGESHRMWPHGNEPAFTLLPTFFLSGMVTMLVALMIIVWSLFFVQTKAGPTVLLFLFVLLLLFGGGIAQIIFFPFIWLVSTRINKPLTWWRKVLPLKIRQLLGKLWLWCLGIGSALLLFALVIAITGFVPGVNDPEIVLSIMIFCLVAFLLVLPLTFITGFAHDIIEMLNNNYENR
jgi:hypothetical protein